MLGSASRSLEGSDEVSMFFAWMRGSHGKIMKRVFIEEWRSGISERHTREGLMNNEDVDSCTNEEFDS